MTSTIWMKLDLMWKGGESFFSNGWKIILDWKIFRKTIRFLGK